MNFTNQVTRKRARVGYCTILSFLALYSPWIWDTTNYESHRSSRFVMESYLATHSLSRTNSYSLLEIANDNLTIWAMRKTFTDCNTMLAPPLTALEEPSVSRIHNGLLMPLCDMSDISEMKLTSP